MGGSIRRFLAGGFVLSILVISLLLTGAATAMAATISTVPSAEPGDTIRVEGSIDLLDLERTVTFHWDDANGPRIGKVGPLALTSYETTVTIPRTATAGEHQIYACNDTCGSATIEVIVETTTTTTPATTTTTTPATTTTTTPATTTAPTAGAAPTTTTRTPSTELPSGPISDQSVKGSRPNPTDDKDASTGTGEESTASGQGAASDEEITASDGETAASDEETSEESQVLSLGRYVPPPTWTGEPTVTIPTPKPTETPENEDVPFYAVEAAKADGGGGFFGSPAFWAIWLVGFVTVAGVAIHEIRAAVRP